MTAPANHGLLAPAMIKYTIEDDFDTDIDHYWELFFWDEAYNDGLYEALEIDRVVNEVTREGEGEALVVRRKITMTPRRDIPAIFKKIVGGGVTYVEDNVFTRRTNTVQVKIIPGFAPDKFQSGGRYIVKELGPRKVRRIFEGEVNCKIPLVGGKVEKHVVDEVKRSYQATTIFTRNWLSR